MKIRNLSLLLIATLFVFAIPMFAQTATTGTTAAPAKSSTKSTSKSASSSAKLDINSASADQLKALPGINDATAQKIIAGRPYHGKNDLVSKNIITKTEYDAIKDQIIAHHVSATGSTKPATK